MQRFSFHTGQPLVLNSVEYVIQRIQENRDVVLERRADLGLVKLSSTELTEAFEAGLLEFVSTGSLGLNGKTNDAQALRTLDSFSDEEQRQALRRKAYVMLAIRTLGNTPSHAGLENHIELFAARLRDPAPPSSITLYRWWLAWSNSGEDIVALVERHGGRTSRYSQEYRDLLFEVIDEKLMQREYGSRQAAFDTFVFRLNGLNAFRTNQLPVPSRATFYRLLKKFIDPYELSKAQQGKCAADMEFRDSGQGIKTTRILERVEIDHTPLDLMVVDEETGETLGRPNLTMLLDHHSRMPMGFYLGFEPPSAVAVMRAMRHAILPKNYVKEAYPEFENAWPAHGIFWQLVCDNGSEFHDHQLKRMAHELNIELFFCPKQQPYYKGTIERFLGTLNRTVCHDLPGTTRSNIQERGSYDSVNRASLTLEQIRRGIHDWIINVYIHDYHEGLGDSPLNVWNKGCQQVQPSLPASRDILDLVLTKEYFPTLNHEGVGVDRLKYNSYQLGLLRRQLPRGSRVKVRVDPENLAQAWVFDEFEGTFFPVPCSESEYAEGLSERQHKHILKSRQDRRSALNTNELLEAKIRQKEELKEAAKGKGVRKRTKVARLTQPSIIGAEKPLPETYKTPAPKINTQSLGEFDIDWGDEA